MNIEVRKYQSKDLDKVNVILKEAFNVEKEEFNNDSFIEIVSLVDNNISGYLYLTKVFNPIKKGYYMLVDYVCVAVNYRGIGVGNKMMDYVDFIAKEEDVMYIQLTCGRDRVDAHKLYESCGYIKRDSDQYRKVL